MKLSVVIATMDRAPYLDRMIASLKRSRVEPDEVVIVDSSRGSETKQMVASWATDWPAMRYLPAPDTGTSKARNAGVQSTDAELVLITDDDCVIHEECIGRVVETFEADAEVDCVTGSVLPYGDVGGKVAVAIMSQSERREWRGKNRPWGKGLSINMAFRREAYQRIGGFDEEMGPGTELRAAEDLDVIYRALVAGAKLVYQPEAIIFHDQWRSRSQARRRRAEYAQGMAAFLLKHLIVQRDGYALRMMLERLWEDVPLLALTGLAKKNLELELVSLYQLSGLATGFWAAARYYRRTRWTGNPSAAARA